MPEGDGRLVRVAVDAMGGDYAPGEIVKGGVLAAEETEVILVGPVDTIEAELAKQNAMHLPIRCVQADEVIADGEPPAMSLRQKPNASVAVAARLVRAGEADAMLSAGSTGALVASALQILGASEGIDRPVAGGPILGFAPKTVILDAGGNVDCKPHHLLSFAIVGCVYAQKMLGVTNPTVALLNVGAEEGKGNELVRESYPLFVESGLNFIGNIEGNDIPYGRANVIVCDGFVGNILLKFTEGLGESVSRWLRTSLGGRLPPSDIESLCDELVSLTNVADTFGGGPLLGINGVAVVMHGHSRAPQVVRGILQAKMAVESGLVATLSSELARIRERRR